MTEKSVQVVSDTHKLTDGQGVATVLSQPVCATPPPSNRRKASRAIAFAKPKHGLPGTNSDGLIRRATQTKRAVSGRAVVLSKPIDRTPGQPISGAQLGRGIHESAEPAGDDRAHFPDERHAFRSPVVAEIVQLWRMRQRWHRAEKALVLQGKALCRSWCGGDKEAASKLFDELIDGGECDVMLRTALLPFLCAIEQFRPERAALEKRLRKLAEQLPVALWVDGVAGFGTLRLASIVGEVGDIGSYRNPSCLWKRMGLAVIRGERQRRVSDAELALEMGYAPERRAIAYLMGQEIMRGAAVSKKETAQRYRAIYDQRREYEMPRCEELTGVMSAKFGKYSPKAHAHNRAARYMTKRVLRDLWAAWRAAA